MVDYGAVRKIVREAMRDQEIPVVGGITPLNYDFIRKYISRLPSDVYISEINDNVLGNNPVLRIHPYEIGKKLEEIQKSGIKIKKPTLNFLGTKKDLEKILSKQVA